MKYVVATLAGLGIIIAYAFLGVAIGWKHGGGYLPLLVLWSVVVASWVAIVNTWRACKAGNQAATAKTQASPPCHLHESRSQSSQCQAWRSGGGRKMEWQEIRLWVAVTSGWLLILAGGPAIMLLSGVSAVMTIPLLFIVAAIPITAGTVGLCGRDMSGLELVIASVASTMAQLAVVGTILFFCMGRLAVTLI